MAENFTIACRVKPSSCKNTISLEQDGSLKISLHAQPHENNANCELRKFLSKTLRISQSSIEIIQGEKSRNKVLRISGVTKEDFLSKISEK